MGRAAWFRSGRAGCNRPLRPGGEFVPTGLHTSVASEGVGEKWTTVQTGELKPGIFHAMLSNWVSPKTSFEHAEPGSSPLSSKSSATTISWRHFLMCPRRGPAAPRSRRFAKTPPTRWRKRSWPILRMGDRSPNPRAARRGGSRHPRPVTAARVAPATAMADEKDFQRRAREDARESEGAIRRLTDGSSATLNSQNEKHPRSVQTFGRGTCRVRHEPGSMRDHGMILKSSRDG